MVQRDSTYALLSKSAKVSLKHWGSLRSTSPLTSFPQAPTSGEVEESVGVKFWPASDDNTCPNYRGVLPRHPQLSEFIPKSLQHPALPELPSIPKKFSNSKPYSTTLRSLPLEILTFYGSSPLLDPCHSKDFSFELEAPTADHTWSPSTVMQLHSLPRS